ncbi:MAG TPA: vWA domain-containing protein [Polyangia bacterium]
MALVLGGTACATTPNLQIKKVSTAVAAPANVAIYLKVTREDDGQPVTLLASDFKVYEDGKQIPAKKLKRALLPTTTVLDRYVSVVVDLSGPLVDSEYLSTLHDAIGNFVDRIAKDTHLSVAAFDGDGLKSFIRYEDTELKPGLAGMRKFRPHNRNIDLWGTYVAALDALDEAASHATAPQHTEKLIFVTDRRDKAGRHSLDEANTKLQATTADSFIIGLGDAINKAELQRLGRPDAFFVEKFRDLNKPFEDVAERIEADRGQDYVFAYCSLQKPGKKSKHKAEVKIGTKQFHGEVELEFSSKDFARGGACDPRQKPDFSARAADAGDGDAGAADEEDAPASKPQKKAKNKKKKAKSDDEDESSGDADE